MQVGYVLLDVACVSANAILSFYLHFSEKSSGRWWSAAYWRLPADVGLRQYAALLLVYTTLIVLLCQSRHLYRTLRERTAVGESLAVAWAVMCATLVLTASIFLSGVKTFSRFVVLLSGGLNLVSLIVWRLARRQLVIRSVTRGNHSRRALIVGAGRVGQALAAHLERNKVLGYEVRGFLDDNHVGDPRIFGRIEDLDRVARSEFVDEIFITIPSEREIVKHVAAAARRRGLDVKLIPELYDGLGWKAPTIYIGDFPVTDLHSKPIPILGLCLKRVLDFAVSATSLVLLAPLFAFLALAIKRDSSGPVLYRSLRIGKKRRTFTCYKFRTMVANADALKAGLRGRNEREGPFFKIADDPRVTYLGRWLRKYSLDELPQLYNVLRGDMSLVGPRPPVPEECAEYRLEYLRRLDVKPGMTGLWQVSARQQPSFQAALTLDIEYIESWNLWLDVEILLKTLPVVLRGLGA